MRDLLTYGVLYHHFQADFLKRQLIMDVTEQFERSRVGHMRATQFDSRWFTGKFRMRFRHFAIEQERNVCVESLLQRKQLLIRSVPLVRLVHYKNRLTRFRVVGDYIDNACSIFAI